MKPAATLIRTKSRAGGMNLALLTCRAFAKRKPVDRQTWRIQLNEAGAHAVCEAPKFSMTFDRKCFAADPRIAKMRWVRGGIRPIA
jgi:hypothetical protein